MNQDCDPWRGGNIGIANERNFLQGIIRDSSSPITLSDAYRGWRQTYGALFVQDDWNVRPGLTVNLGLRWERVTNPVEVNGKMAGLPDLLRDSQYTQYKDSYFHLRDSFKGFAPRVGFAWTPFAGQGTVLRGAFGLFKEIPLLYTYQLAFSVPPWAEKFTISNPPWPNPIGGTPKEKLRAGEPNVMDRDIKYPYSLQWSFGIEHQLTETMVAKAGYIGTRGISMIAAANANQRIPELRFDSTVGHERWFTPVNAVTPNPNFTSTRSFHNLGDSWYNSLQLQLQQRYTSGVNYNVSYTFSKNIDTVGIGLKCGETTSSGSWFLVANLWDVAGDKSLSNIHVAHNYTSSFGYELPFGQGKRFGSNWNRALSLLAGNWQLNGIVTARTGNPVNIRNGFQTSRSGHAVVSDRPDLARDPALKNWTVDEYFDTTAFRLQPPGFFGNAPRQSVVTPGVVNVNISAFKGFPVGEGKLLEFRAEAFNLINHANFGSPSATMFTNAAGLRSATAGQITSLRTTPRQIQLALKFVF